MANNRRAQVDLAVGADTSGAKTSIEDLKKSIEGIGQAGTKATDEVARATGFMERALQRSTREQQKLNAELSAGPKDTVEYIERLAVVTGAQTAKLTPLIEKYRELKTANDGLADSYRLSLQAVVDAQRRLGDTSAFEKQHQAAKLLVRDTEYVRWWNQAISEKEAVESKAASNNAFIESLRKQSEAIGKSRVDLLEMQAAQMGLAKESAPFIAKLRESEGVLKKSGVAFNEYGISAKQTAAALRQVPAQLTDIFVSLQGGQAPLTVLLQQGGQLKDIFGGIVPAAKALGGALLGLINPYTILAGTIGGLVYGYNKGANEALAFEKTLISTGNAAGVSGSQLGIMAATLDRIGGGTQSKAAEALNLIAAAGVRGAANVQRLTAAAIEFERSGGAAVEKTVEAFKELERAPLQASIKLNESMNYLTRSTYEQIKALEDQGRTTEAAAAAQEAYADALEQRTPEMVRQLGYVERAWRGIKDVGAEAVDALLNIGRNDLGAQLERIASQIAVAEAAARNGPRDLGGGVVDRSAQANLENLRQQQSLLQEKLRLEQRSAVLRGDAAAQTRAEIELSKLKDKYLDDQVRKQREINVLVQTAMRTGQTEIEARKSLAKEIAAIEKRYEKKGSKSEYERELERQNKLINELSGVTADFDEELQRLYATKQRLNLSDEQYNKLLRELLDKQPVFKELAKQQADAEKERAKALKEANDAQAKNLAGLDKQIEGNEKTLAGLREELIGITMGKQARAEAIAQRYEEAAAQAEQNAQLAYMGDFNEYEKLMKIAEGLRAVAAERRKIAPATVTKEIDDEFAKSAKKAQDEWEKASDQIGQSLADALMEGGKSAAEYIKGVFRTMVLKPIIQGTVQPVVNQILGAAGGGNNYLQSAQALNSIYGYGKAAYGTVAGWLGYGSATGLAAGGGAAASIGGTSAGAVMGGTGTAAAGGSAAGAAAISWTTWAAAIAAGVYKASKDYDEGFRRDQARDVSQSVWGGRGLFGDLQPMGGLEETKADFFSMLGFSDKWADLLSGATAVSKLFGRAAPQITGQGIQGTIGAGDFTGQAYADIYEKGGLFRSSKSYQQFADLPEEVGRFLDGAASGIFEKAKEYGAALGLPVESLASITADLKVQIGDDAEKNKEEILKALGGYGDALVAGWTEALKPLAMYGETVTQTIERVGTAILGVNGILEMIGKTALAASIDGGKAAIALTDLFGGAENLIAATTGYYEAYFSEAEKAARSTQLVTDALAEVGIAMPDSRAAFRALVEGLDLTTAAGREQFAVMMKVSDAFAQLNPLAEELAGNLDGLKDSMDELEDLVSGLEDILGITAKSIQEVLAEMIEGQQRLQGFRAGLQDDIRQYTLAGMSPADRIAALKAREEQLFAELPDATDPVAVAEQLTGVILDRVQEEAALRQQVDADHLDALREQLSSLERMQDLSQRLAQFTASLRSSDLSPLSYRDQLNAAGSLFDTTLAQAQAGDVMAQQNLQGNAQSYLQEARAFFGSSSDYADVFRRVTSGLDSVGGASVDPQIKAIRDQVAALEALGNSAGDMAESSIAIAEALTRVDGILDVREDQEAARIAAQTQLALDQIAELAKIVEAEKDTAGAVALGNVKIVEQLVYLSGRIDRLLENAQLEATAP